MTSDRPDRICRKCGQEIDPTATRFGSAATGWEHMGDCPMPESYIVARLRDDGRDLVGTARLIHQIRHTAANMIEAQAARITELERATIKIDGFMWCLTHGDIAQEGTDYSEVCAAVYYDREPDETAGEPCSLVALYHRAGGSS